MIKFVTVVIITAGFLWTFFDKHIYAQETNSFVTIVYPIRNRNLWPTSDISQLDEQIVITDSLRLPATYLVQYDVLFDDQITTRLKKIKVPHEVGIFLEASESLATDSFVPYTVGSGDWAEPDKAFFSGYYPNERFRMVDRLIRKFQLVFGSMPQMVGAWYLDPRTLVYLREKYHINTALTVADQYSTDKYHIWGTYFGVPYYPSRYNSLMPAQSLNTKLDMVIVQWAQRDPIYGYGFGVNASTFSLQANDYFGHHQLSTDYFSQLFSSYAFEPANTFNQVTVGLEVGQEAAFLPELSRQLRFIAELNNKKQVNVVLMSDFAEWYRNTFSTLSPPHIVRSGSISPNDTYSFWYMTPWYRINFLLDKGKLIVRDFRIYNDTFIEKDFLFPDRRTTLYRTVPGVVDDLVLKNALPVASNVLSLQFRASDQGVNLLVTTNNDNISINLLEKKIEGLRNLPGQGYVTNPNQSYLSISVKKELLDFADGISSVFPQIRYSVIAGSPLYGFTMNQNSIFGMSTHPVKIGIFTFPFQTLAHFKIFPKLPIEDLISTDSRRQARQAKVNCSVCELVRREKMSLEEATLRENAGQIRVLENSEYSLWKKALPN